MWCLICPHFEGYCIMKISQFVAGCALGAVSLSCVAQVDQTPLTSENTTLNIARGVQDISRLPRYLDWVVDGRSIFVTPSSVASNLNVTGHWHPNAHVGGNQLHGQGNLVGYSVGTSPRDTSGSVVGAVVYTVVGSTAGSNTSRINEKVVLFNRGAQPVSLDVNGLFSRPTTSTPPDLTGLEVWGSTMTFIQGNGFRDPQGVAHAGVLSDLPPGGTGYATIPGPGGPSFASITHFPSVTFTGFNTFAQKVDLQPGASLIMITELNVRPDISPPGGWIEGESYTSSQGVAVENTHLASLDNGDWAGYNQVNVTMTANAFEAMVAVDPQFANQRLEIRLGSATGTKVGELRLLSTGGFGNFQLQTTTLTQPVIGVHNVVLVPVGSFGAANLDKFRFIQR